MRLSYLNGETAKEKGLVMVDYRRHGVKLVILVRDLFQCLGGSCALVGLVSLNNFSMRRFETQGDKVKVHQHYV